ncbi:MAG: hypothetical protein ACJAYG_000673, partial [Oceanicoccus sp.]
EADDYQLSFNSPTNNTVIANGLVGFVVQANIDPALKQGHLLQLSINGDIHSKAATNQIIVNSIDRGEHMLKLAIINHRGDTITSSDTINIVARRPSSQVGSNPPPRVPRPRN